MLGAVLAGGQSRRFGRDKTAVPVEGVPMALRAVRVLDEVCDDVVIISSLGVPASWGRVLPDLRPGLGPLAGIETALRHAAAEGAATVFVLASDLPRVDVGIVREVVGGLRSAAEDTLASTALRVGDPDFEPLCALYRVECAEVAGRLLDSGARAARALVEAVGATKVVLTPEAAAAVSLNVNHPEDLDRLP